MATRLSLLRLARESLAEEKKKKGKGKHPPEEGGGAGARGAGIEPPTSSRAARRWALACRGFESHPMAVVGAEAEKGGKGGKGPFWKPEMRPDLAPLARHCMLLASLELELVGGRASRGSRLRRAVAAGLAGRDFVGDFGAQQQEIMPGEEGQITAEEVEILGQVHAFAGRLARWWGQRPGSQQEAAAGAEVGAHGGEKKTDQMMPSHATAAASAAAAGLCFLRSPAAYLIQRAAPAPHPPQGGRAFASVYGARQSTKENNIRHSESTTAINSEAVVAGAKPTGSRETGSAGGDDGADPVCCTAELLLGSAEDERAVQILCTLVPLLPARQYPLGRLVKRLLMGGAAGGTSHSFSAPQATAAPPSAAVAGGTAVLRRLQLAWSRPAVESVLFLAPGVASVCMLAENTPHLRTRIVTLLCQMAAGEHCAGFRDPGVRDGPSMAEPPPAVAGEDLVSGNDQLKERALHALHCMVSLCSTGAQRASLSSRIVHELLKLHACPGFVLYLSCLDASQTCLLDLLRGRCFVLGAREARSWVARFLRGAEQQSSPGPVGPTPWSHVPYMSALVRGELESQAQQVLEDTDVLNELGSAAETIRAFALFYSSLNVVPEASAFRNMTKLCVSVAQRATRAGFVDHDAFNDFLRASLCLAASTSRNTTTGEVRQDAGSSAELLQIIKHAESSGFTALFSLLMGAHVGGETQTSDAIDLLRFDLRVTSALSSQSIEAVASVLRDGSSKADLERALKTVAAAASSHASPYVSSLLSVVIGDASTRAEFGSALNCARDYITSKVKDLLHRRHLRGSIDADLLSLMWQHTILTASSESSDAEDLRRPTTLSRPVSRAVVRHGLKSNSCQSHALLLSSVLAFNDQCFSTLPHSSRPSQFGVTYYRPSDLYAEIPSLREMFHRASGLTLRNMDTSHSRLSQTSIHFHETMAFFRASQLSALFLPRHLAELEGPHQETRDSASTLIESIASHTMTWFQQNANTNVALSQALFDSGRLLSLVESAPVRLDEETSSRLALTLTPLLSAPRTGDGISDGAVHLLLQRLSAILLRVSRGMTWRTCNHVVRALSLVSQSWHPNKADSLLSADDLCLDPLSMFRADHGLVLLQPTVLPLALHCVEVFAEASRRQIHEHAVVCGTNEFASTAIALILAQDSAVIQQLFEVINLSLKSRRRDKDNVIGFSAMFIHQLFVEQQLLIKLVHFQGFPRARTLLPLLCATVPCLHVAAGFVFELFARPHPQQQLMAIALCASLSHRFVIPSNLNMCRQIISILRGQIRQRNDARLSEDRRRQVDGAVHSLRAAEGSIRKAHLAMKEPGSFSDGFASHALASATKRRRSGPSVQRVAPDTVLVQGLHLVAGFCRPFPVLTAEFRDLLSDVDTSPRVGHMSKALAAAQHVLSQIVAELHP